MISIIIAPIIILLAIIFLSNATFALIQVYNSEDKKYFMNKYLVAIGGFCTFLCILGFMVIGLANIELKKQLKAVPVKYELIKENLYREIP